MIWPERGVEGNLSFLLSCLDRFLPVRLPGGFFGRDRRWRPDEKEMEKKRGKE
jgi:hypothetical protein